MKRVIKQSMKEMLSKCFAEFSHEKEQDTAQIESYTNKFIDDFERYLNAYYDFKED